jgi:hypothetical protein
LIVVAGISPIREALMAVEELPEQQWASWTSFPTDKLQLHEPLPRLSSRDQKLTQLASRSAIELARQALEQVSGGHVEHHSAPFGHILVAPASTKDGFVAFAINAEWPHSILEVDWIDRRQGMTRALDVDLAGVTALAKQRLVGIFTAVRTSSPGSVENTAHYYGSSSAHGL